MRLLFLALYFHPAVRYGGPIASTRALTRALAAGWSDEEGLTVRVATTDADGPGGRVDAEPGWSFPLPGGDRRLAVRYFRRWPAGSEDRQAGGDAFFSPRLAAALPGLVARADVVQVSGLMVWPLPLVLLLTRLLRRPLVVSPRGMLLPAALGSKGGKKGLFLTLLRGLGLERAVLHATSREEAESCREHLPGARVVLIPNGVRVPGDEELARAREAKHGEVAGGEAESGEAAGADAPYLLYLGRLHPHKELPRLLSAFSRLPALSRAAVSSSEEALPRLVLAGPDEGGHRAELERHAERLGLGDRVRFAGPVAGEEKARLLARAAGLVLASRSESFGMSVAEALAHAVPVVVARTAPWPGVETHRCGFWVEPTEPALAEAMGRLLTAGPAERRERGERGRRWMRDEMSWQQVARRMASLYRELAGEGPAAETGNDSDVDTDLQQRAAPMGSAPVGATSPPARPAGSAPGGTAP